MRPKILVVEDDLLFALDMQEKLNSLGFEVPEIAVNAEDAIRLARLIQPDLILMDIHLPGAWDGIQVAQVIEEELAVPIIYSTSHTDRKHMERAKLTHPYAILSKPYNEKELLRTIEISLDRAELQRMSVENEKKFKRIFENAADSLFLLDGKGDIIDCNSEAMRELGYAREELAKVEFHKLASIDSDQFRSHLTRCVVDESTISFESEFVRKDATMFPCEVRMGVFENDSQWLYIATARNVGERRKAENDRRNMMMQLTHAGKLAILGTMSAGVIHELKNPLASILGILGLLEDKEQWNEGMEEKLALIRSATTRMKDFVDHLRVFSRQDSFNDLSEVNLNEAIDESLKLLKTKIGSAELKLTKSPEIPLIMGNISQLQSVVQNFILNSSDAFLYSSQTEPTIVIKTYASGEAVYLEYEDNAGGIAKEHIGQIFNPFFTTKKAGVGTGLGLSIVKYVMQHHKGHIQVSVKKKRGTKFVLKFPIKEHFAGKQVDSAGMVTWKFDDEQEALVGS
ncbi:MAG: response regulator [Deltaproteobacteria bacterium]|nr:response regulator [Deltaproteobacteria bacterium]